MAIFFSPRTEVATAAAAIWGLQLGNTTMTDVLQIAAANGGLANVIGGAFDASFPTSGIGAVSNTALANMVVANLGLTGAMATAGAGYIAGELAAAAPGARGATVLAIVKQFANLSNTGDAAVDAAVAAFNSKVADAVTYSSTVGTADVAFDSIPAATSFDLTTGHDVLTGSAAADTFLAYVFDNSNTLQSGDRIDGGAGVDKLEATLGNSSNFAILPITSNLEQVFIRSQANNASGNNGDNNVSADPVADSHADDNTLDAELMQGVKQWWSTDSRADLVIEDVRILNNEITKDIAIGWRNADPSSIEYRSSTDQTYNYVDKVDYEVYFSPESLRKQGDTTANAIQLTVGNQVEVGDFDPANPLKDIPYTFVQFLVDGQQVALQLDLADITTYDDLWVELQASFAAAKTANPALLGDLTLERTIDGNTFFSRDGIVRKADVFTLANPNGTIAPAAIGWAAEGGLPSNNAFSANVKQGAPVTTSDLITGTIFLDNVGRESESGDLVVGSMSTRTGVERFDITVLNNDNTSGAYTTSGSWVGEMRSTNNFLREVIAKNDSVGITSPDYLYIGTGMDDDNNNLTTIRQTFLSTQSTIAGFAKYQAAVDAALLNTDGLMDVRVFDASAMTGKVKVGAHITEAAIQKYQDLVDTNPNDGFDDVNFAYNLGKSNDSINLELDSSLWYSNSLATVGRHDFSFDVNGNAGNDHIVVTISGDDENGETWGQYEHWYVNQQINQNITINGGAGDDTIWTPGAGDMSISGGTGNDTIYADNTGGEDFQYNEGKAAWVFNENSDYVYDLESQPAAQVKAVNAQLTVDFRGFTKTVTIGDSMGKLANVTITDLTVNQAIKAAINDDAVLSKLLVAEDGPGRTLIVRSLIDGYMDRYDDSALSISFKSTALTTTQAAIVGLVRFDATALKGGSLLDGYELNHYVNDDWSDLTGQDSVTTSDNTIEGGTGNDVIVLGTTRYLDDSSTDQQIGSNDTIVYTGFGNGTDSIVNFDTTVIPPGETTYVGQSARSEVIRLTFSASDGSPAAQTITFDGSTVVLSAPATQGVIPAADVAFQFARNYIDPDWTVTGHTVGTNSVTLTKNVAGALTPDVVAADITGTYKDAAATGGGGTVGVTTTTQGRDAIVVGTESQFTVTFDVPGTAADAAGSFTFDGATVGYAEGDGAVTLAGKLAAATFANWDVSPRFTTATTASVTFTAKAPGATAIGVDADFDVGTNVIVGTVLGAVGTANVGTPIAVPSPGGPGSGFDYLDFSAYDPAGVMVNGVVLVDVAGDAYTVGNDAPNNTTYSYVRMTESSTNPGEYKIELVTVDDNTPVTTDVVQLIGVADFGDQALVNFVAENFIV